jgi:hypothetical protein
LASDAGSGITGALHELSARPGVIRGGIRTLIAADSETCMLFLHRTLGFVAVLTISVAPGTPVLAQQEQAAPPRVEERTATRMPTLVPPGMIMGPGIMRGAGLGRSCDPRTVGLTGWRMDRLQETLKLSTEQKARLDEVRAASESAVEHFVANCPREMPLTPAGRLELLEARLSAMLEGVRTLRAAFDGFYGSLSDEQKAWLTPDSRERGWRFEEDVKSDVKSERRQRRRDRKRRR